LPGYRINRRTFWVCAVLAAGFLALFAAFAGWSAGGIIVAATGLAVPRLHDIGRSGWWAALAFAPALLLIPFAFMPDVPNEVLALPRYGAFVLVGLGLAVLGVIPGHPGSNRYGEPQRSRI
jgi:uncharacterized membrane protein YhaH (DUF805 family)